MRRCSRVAVYLVMAALVSVALGARPQAASRRYIVVLTSRAAPETVLARHRFVAGHVYRHALRGFAATLTPAKLSRLKADPDVAYVEPDVPIFASQQTLPRGVDRIGADTNPVARIDGFDGTGERVDADIAIMDTGIDLDHPDLNVVYDRNFIKPRKSANDDDGHGTHVAGIAAALDNDIGTVGVAPGARLWALKVLDSRGSGYVSDAIEAIDFVTLHADEVEVVNMSFSTVGRITSFRTAIQNSVAQGVVYVAAAGNDSRDVYGPDGVFDTSDDTIPAAYPEVVAVSAMADSDGKAGGLGPVLSGELDDTVTTFTGFSGTVVAGNPVVSPGAAIDLAAPGVGIYSTYLAGGYTTIGGTSMASPHVAGAVALYIAANGRAHNAAGVAQIRQALIDRAELQAAWGPADTRDPDGNREGLVNVAFPALEIAAALADGEDWVYQNTQTTTQDRHASLLTVSLVSEAEPGEEYIISIEDDGPDTNFTLGAVTDNRPVPQTLTVEIVGGRVGASTIGADGAVYAATVTFEGMTSGRSDSAQVQLVLRTIGDVDGDGSLTGTDKQYFNQRLNNVSTPYTDRTFDLDGSGGAPTGTDKQVINQALNNVPLP